MRKEFGSWENFKRLVKRAREFSVDWRKDNPELWNPAVIKLCTAIKIKNYKGKCFVELNPYCVNLRTGEYGGTCICRKHNNCKRFVSIPNLKEVFLEVKQK